MASMTDAFKDSVEFLVKKIDVIWEKRNKKRNNQKESRGLNKKTFWQHLKRFGKFSVTSQAFIKS